MRAQSLLAVAALFAAPSAGRAQDLARVALARIRPGRDVRVTLEGGERLQGQWSRLTQDSILLLHGGTPRWIALRGIEELHERGRATRTAATVGAVVGGVATGFLVTVGCAIGRADDGVIGNEDQWVDCAVVGALIGGAGGAALGAGVGALIPKWHLRYRARH